MRTFMGRNINRMRLRREQNGTPIVLRWTSVTTPSGETAVTDPLTGQQTNGTATEQTQTIMGLVHFIQPAVAGFRVFVQLVTGDAILDLDGSVDLEAKPNLTFEFGGSQWTQKDLPDEVTRALDAVYSSDVVSRVVVVTLKR